MPRRKKIVLNDLPKGVGTTRYAWIDGNVASRLFAFDSTKTLRIAQALDAKLQQIRRVQAVDDFGIDVVAEVELNELDAAGAVRVFGDFSKVAVGRVAINGKQYVTMKELSDLTGVSIRTLQCRRGLPKGSVSIRRTLVPVSTETVLWAKGEIPGSSPDVEEIE